VSRRLAILLCAWFFCLRGSGAEEPSDSVAPMLFRRMAEVSVTVQGCDQQRGSGTIVAFRGHIVILTAYHVFELQEPETPPVLRLFAPPEAAPPNPNWPPCDLADCFAERLVWEGSRRVGRDVSLLTWLWASPAHDLAVVTPLRRSFLQNHAVLAQINPALGEDVHLISSRYGSAFAHSLSRGIVSGVGHPYHSRHQTEPFYLDQTDAGSSMGSSGGGVFNVQGELAGMVLYREVDESDLTLYLPVETIRQCLEQLWDE
jgi:hypothetical protein